LATCVAYARKPASYAPRETPHDPAAHFTGAVRNRRPRGGPYRGGGRIGPGRAGAVLRAPRL